MPSRSEARSRSSGSGSAQAATACALVELDEGRPIGAAQAYWIALRRIRLLLRAIVVFVVAWVGLTLTTFLTPVAIWLAVRWCCSRLIVELSVARVGRCCVGADALCADGGFGILLVGVSAFIALAAGPLLGVVLIFTTSMPLAFLNVVAGLLTRSRFGTSRSSRRTCTLMPVRGELAAGR